MSTLSHDPSTPLPQSPGWPERLRIPEMWASIAITAMWLAVLFDAIWGPDFVTHDSSGGSTTIPSAIVIALFAWLGTKVVAKYGFGHSKD